MNRQGSSVSASNGPWIGLGVAVIAGAAAPLASYLALRSAVSAVCFGAIMGAMMVVATLLIFGAIEILKYLAS